MALRERNRVKLITSATGLGTLVADADEAFRVRDIYCVPGAGETYIEVLVHGVVLAKLRALGKAGNCLPCPMVKTAQVYEGVVPTIFAWAAAHDFDLSIPVASGETLTISRVAAAGFVVLVYDVYDPPDVAPDEPNGSRSALRRYLHYGENAAAITTSPAAIDTTLIWSGGDGFPFNGNAVPERNRYRIVAILGAPIAHGDASANKGYSTYLKLIKRNDVLFDEDRNGLPFKGNSAATADSADYVSLGSVIGPLTAENPTPGLWLPDPIVLDEGDRLTTQLVVADAAATGIAASEVDVAYLMEHEYLS